MNIRAVDFVFYPVPDFDKGLKFYRDVLGLKPTSEVAADDSWVEFDLGNVTLAIGNMGEEVVPGYKGGAVVALAVEDMGQAITELKQHGSEVPELGDYESCAMVTITDPFGNKLMLHQRKDGTAG